MLKNNITQNIREIPVNFLFSVVVHAMHRMQNVVHKDNGHIETDLNMLKIRLFYFSIDYAFLKTLFSITERLIYP